ALQIDVIGKDHEPPLRELLFDPTRGIRQDHRLDAHPGKHADGERDILHGVAFVKVHATLHCGDLDAIHLANHQLAGVADGRRAGKVGNLSVRNARGVSELVCKRSQSGAQHQCDLWQQLCFLQKIACRRFRTDKFLSGVDAFLFFQKANVRIPTIQADMRLAIVPASMARIPNLANCPRCSGARAPIPPIWMPMELKLAKPQSAKVAMVKERGSSEPLNWPSFAKATTSLMVMRVPSR